MKVPETALSFPVLNGTLVGLGFDEMDELAFNFVFGAEFKTFHLLDDLAVEVICAEGFAVDNVSCRWGVKAPNHPWMAHHLGESSTLRRVGDEHS